MLSQQLSLLNEDDRSASGWFSRPSLQVAMRLALCSAFIFSGITKLLDFQGAVIEVRSLIGLEPAALFAALVILVQLGGSALLLAGRRLGLAGAALLAGFTFVATLLAHAAWIGAAWIGATGIEAATIQSGPSPIAEANTFFEHLGLIAGLLLAGGLAARDRAR